MKYLPLWFLLFILVISCSKSEVCDQKVNALLVADFFTLEGTEEKDTLLQWVTVYGIKDTISRLYDTAVNINHIELPLDPNANQVKFVIEVDSVYDTLTVHYQGEIQFVSYPCGFGSVFYLDTVLITKHVFDSLFIIEPAVNPENEQNLKIYL